MSDIQSALRASGYSLLCMNRVKIDVAKGNFSIRIYLNGYGGINANHLISEIDKERESHLDTLTRLPVRIKAYFTS